MINLLPPEVKQSYRYARRNVGLRRWVFIMLFALIGLGAITTYGLLAFEQSTKTYNKQVATSQETLKREKFDDTQQRIKDINNSFKLVVKVLSQEVLFSKLLTQMAKAIPANANLTGLTINQLQGGLDISANATDYYTATQVQVNLADPDNKIFSKADLVSINCSSKPSSATSGSATYTNSKYPCAVTLRALFADNNPFLFINNKAVKP